MENKNASKITAIILALVILLTVLPLQVFANSPTVVDSGYCGFNMFNGVFSDLPSTYTDMTWTLYDDGRLVISGKGEMDYYSDNSKVPWSKYISQVKTVEIEDGVETIGNGVFQNFDGINGKIVIPDSVKEIGRDAFAGCTGITELLIGNGVKQIDMSAFYNCGGLNGDLILPNELEIIGIWSFGFCDGITRVYMPNNLKCVYPSAFNACKRLTDVFFYGDAPVVGAADGYRSFPKEITVYYIEGKNGWKDSENYDASAGTWNGYKLKTWDGIIPSTPSEWAKDEVNAAIEAGLVPISIQKKYNKPVTRGDVAGMFITLLEKVYGKSVDEIMKDKGVSINENAFTDTNDKSVFAANALGIINGVGNGKFSPDGTLKRAQIAAIINRVAMVMGVNTKGYTHSFTDIIDNYAWANTELGWPVSVGIIKGVGDGRFNPGGELTTEQAIVITYRAYNVLIK